MKRLFLMIALSFFLIIPSVYAGHTLAGTWCQDGTPGCLPDEMTAQSAKPKPTSGVELIGALIAVLAIARWRMLR